VFHQSHFKNCSLRLYELQPQRPFVLDLSEGKELSADRNAVDTTINKTNSGGVARVQDTPLALSRFLHVIDRVLRPQTECNTAFNKDKLSQTVAVLCIRSFQKVMCSKHVTV
jgi:hypothetical protein